MVTDDEVQRIRYEARDAAQKYKDINDVCPYPFMSYQGQVYKIEFERVRQILMQTWERA